MERTQENTRKRYYGGSAGAPPHAHGSNDLNASFAAGMSVLGFSAGAERLESTMSERNRTWEELRGAR